MVYADLLGSPPHGLVVDEPGELLLVPFAESLSQAQQALLVQHPRLRVPAADVPAFAAEFAPVLRRLVDLIELEGRTSSCPRRPPPPRLLLRVRVRVRPRHRT